MSNALLQHTHYRCDRSVPLHLPTHVAAIALGSPLPVGELGGLSRYGRGPWGPFAILGSYDYTPQLDKDNGELRG